VSAPTMESALTSLVCVTPDSLDSIALSAHAPMTALETGTATTQLVSVLPDSLARTAR